MAEQRMKEERSNDGADAGKGDTVPVQGENQVPKARMPHERDESADSREPASAQVRRMGDIAKDSVDRGERDTSKGDAMDATYQKVKKA
ncbi:hypothetical protein HK414_02430 [Ramlibacter terrae]|uniref:CsbD family protein n=1 Tax=Ramlibacter terrae TaxID=2732511 RepID=A0ABX6P2S7_9BURK|nr:hypothetical protein HK414_02430 [Ramlibacter terrae]